MLHWIVHINSFQKTCLFYHIMNSIKPDILPNKHRPSSSDGYRCHSHEAVHLKQWILEFINESKIITQNYHDNSSDSEPTIKPKCVLLTGSPGIGKTSLVYAIAEELKMHVVESNPSEKRDFKLFSSLKLANQKGKINPIAKLFQFAQHKETRRKRLKLIDPNPPDISTTTNNQLSLSGDSSIVLFDDIDVVFEEDGPFLKSLVEFIRESKRPVILTATQSIGHIKNQLGLFEHIHLNKPNIKTCALVLKDVCKRESYHKLTCLKIAQYYDCDIRQCLNRIHFYKNKADQFPLPNLTQPDFTRLNLNDTSDNRLILNCYNTSSLVDLMTDRLGIVSKTDALKKWLNGMPSSRIYENYDSNQNLGEEIRECIIELNQTICQSEMMTEQKRNGQQDRFMEVRDQVTDVGYRISDRLVTRVEPHELEFFIDIVPLFYEIVRLEAERKANGDQLKRRTRRTPSYLDDNGIYFDAQDLKRIAEVGDLMAELDC